MTKTKEIKPAGTPEVFFEMAEKIVYERMEPNHAALIKESLSHARRRMIFGDLADEIWATYQHFLVTREKKTIPAKRYDTLVLTALHTCKDKVVLLKQKKKNAERAEKLLAEKEEREEEKFYAEQERKRKHAQSVLEGQTTI